jgi:hypothetical protein
VAVADDLELVLLPAEHRLVDEHLADHRGLQAASDDLLELLEVVGDAAAHAPERVRRADDRRQPDLDEEVAGLLHGGHGPGPGLAKPKPLDERPERLAILRAADHLAVGADHLDAHRRERALVMQRAGAVEGGLPAEGRQQRIDRRAELPFPLEDLPDRLRGDGLDVGPIREVRIGHDGGGVRVDEDDPVALLSERLARLGAGVVELASLADHDRARADDEDGVEVFSSRHAVPPVWRKVARI